MQRQGCREMLHDGIGRRAVLQQNPSRIEPASRARQMECSELVHGASLDIHVVAQQECDDLVVAVAGCNMQGRVAFLVKKVCEQHHLGLSQLVQTFERASVRASRDRRNSSTAKWPCAQASNKGV
eukprot:m.146047 g.146047  ORF g.146047 m.146047 type:complete len:125 (+) comp10089_c0_seq1:588-962(+)